MKRSHAYKGFAITYSVQILNSFTPELQLKNTESAIKNKLKYFLAELRGFKFVTIETIIHEMTLLMYLNQSAARSYQTYKNLLEKVWAGLPIQLSVALLIFQSTTP